MAINYYFFNAVESGGVYDRTYNADDLCGWLDKIVGTGVFANPSTNLQVAAVSGMNIKVRPGSAWIFGHKMDVDADVSLTISAADVALDRIDRVIAYCDWSTRTMGIDVLTGTPAGSPSAPAVTQNKGTRYELALADVLVPRQATQIVYSYITDMRGSSYCGYVAGLVTELDTATLFQQWQDAFDTWFATVTTANFIQKHTFASGFMSQAQMDDSLEDLYATYDHASDVVEVYANGYHLAEGIDYNITQVGGEYYPVLAFTPSDDIAAEVVIYTPIQLS